MIAHFEKITDRGEAGSFHCRCFDVPSFGTPWHFHPEWELTLIVESRGQRFVGDNIAAFAPGDLVLLGPNLPHCWLNVPSPEGYGASVGRARSVVVQFGANLLGAGWQEGPEMRAVRSLLTDRASRGVCFVGPAAQRLGGRLAALPGQHALPRLLELVALLDALARLPARAARPLASEGFTPALNLAQAKRLETICRFVHGHFRDAIRLAEMAALAHLTPEAFSRFFKQKTGKTFVEFLNDVRIGEACRLLIEQETLGVTEICYACGFENVSNFNRHFRLRHRLSPRDFRRRFLSAAAVRAP